MEPGAESSPHCPVQEPCSRPAARARGGRAQVPALLLTCLAAASPGHRLTSAAPRRPKGELFPQHRNCKGTEGWVCSAGCLGGRPCQRRSPKRRLPSGLPRGWHPRPAQLLGRL